MKLHSDHITITDWFFFLLTTCLIFLSSLLLVITGAIYYLIRFARRRPFLFIISILLLVIVYVLVQWMIIPISWHAQEDSIFIIIKEGDNLHQIIGRLKEANLITNGTSLLILAEILDRDQHIQAGKYNIKKGITLFSILGELSQGKVILKSVTIPEGSTVFEIGGILKREIQIDSAEFVRASENGQIARSMNLPVSNLEGYLFPETYKLTWGISPEKVARIMVEQFRKVFSDSLLERAKEFNFSLPEVITLASLIEAEAKEEKERSIISAIFHNRLRLGMFLQSCPTVTYGLPDFDRPLTLKELERDSPYNTYKYPGLPPGPICNPGKASILAALYPANVDYLYFVSQGNGSHIFSRTLNEHNRAKNKIKQAQKKQT
jgi:UPF0755 protein